MKKRKFKLRKLKARILVLMVICTMLLSGCNTLFGGRIGGAEPGTSSGGGSSSGSEFDEFKEKNNLVLSERGGLDISLNFDGNYEASKYSSSYGDAFFIAEDLSNSTDDLNYFEFLDVIDNTYMVYVYQTLKYANNERRDSENPYQSKEVKGAYVMYPEVIVEEEHEVSDTLVTVFAVYDYRAQGKSGYCEIGRWSAKKDSDNAYVMAISSYSEDKKTQDLSTACYCLCTMGEVMVYKKAEIMNCVSKNKYGLEISGTDGKTITPITYNIDQYYRQYLKENEDLANRIKNFEIDIFNIGCKVDERGYYIYVDMSATNSNISANAEDEKEIQNGGSGEYSDEDYAKAESEVDEKYGSGSYDFLCTIVNADVDDIPIVCEPHANRFFYEYMDTWDYPYDEAGYQRWIYTYYLDVITGAPTWDLQNYTCTARIGVDIGGSTYYLTEQSGLNPILCGYATASVNLLDSTRISKVMAKPKDEFDSVCILQAAMPFLFNPLATEIWPTNKWSVRNGIYSIIQNNNYCQPSFVDVEIEKALLDLYEEQVGKRTYNLTPTKPITGNHIIVSPEFAYCYNSPVDCNIKVDGYLKVERTNANVNKLNAYVHNNEYYCAKPDKVHSLWGEPKTEEFNMVLTDAHMEGVSFSNYDASSSESLFVHDNCIVGWIDDTKTENGKELKGKKFYLIPNSMSARTPIAGDYKSNWLGITQFLTGHNFKKLEMKVTDDKDYIYAIADDYLVAYQVKNLNSGAANIYKVDLSKFQVNKMSEEEETLSVEGVLSEDNKLLLDNRGEESGEFSEFLKNLEDDKKDAINTTTGSIVPIQFPISKDESEMVTLFFDNVGVQIFDSESIKVGIVSYEDISKNNILNITETSSINELFEDETIRKYWYVSSNSETGKLMKANGDEIFSIASKIKENLHYRYTIALQKENNTYNVTVTDKSNSDFELEFTYDAGTDLNDIGHAGIDNASWKSIVEYLKANTKTSKVTKQYYEKGSKSFGQYSARNLTLMYKDFEGLGFSNDYWVSNTSLYGLSMMRLGSDSVFVPTFQRVKHTMNTTHVSNKNGEAISDEQSLQNEIIQLDGISCYGLYQNTGKDKGDYPYIFIGFDNQDNVYTENELVRAKVIPFGIKTVFKYKYTDSQVKSYLDSLEIGDNANPSIFKPLDGESVVYYLKDTYVNKNGQKILNPWENFEPMEPSGKPEKDPDDPGPGEGGEDGPGTGEPEDDPHGPGKPGGDDPPGGPEKPGDDDPPGGPGDPGNDPPGGPEKPGDDDPPGGPEKPGDDDPPGGPEKPGDDDPPGGPEKPGDDDPPGGPEKPGDDDPPGGPEKPGDDPHDPDDPGKKPGTGDDDPHDPNDPGKEPGTGDDDDDDPDDPGKKPGTGDDDDDDPDGPGKKPGTGDDDDDDPDGPGKKTGDGDDDDDDPDGPGKKPGTGDDDDDDPDGPNKKKGDGDDDDPNKKGDGDDDDPSKKKGGNGDDDDPSKKKGGNGDDDTERKGQKIDDNTGDNKYSGKVEDNKPKDLLDINDDAYDGRSIKDKIKDYLGEDDSLEDADEDGDGQDDEDLLDQMGDKLGNLSDRLKSRLSFSGEKVITGADAFSGEGIGVKKTGFAALLDFIKRFWMFILIPLVLAVGGYVAYRKKKGLPIIPEWLSNIFRKNK